MMSRIGNRQRTGHSVKRIEKKKLTANRCTSRRSNLTYGRDPDRGFSRTSGLYAREGFTLIEVLLTVSILAIGLTGVLRSYAAAVNVLGVSQENVDAVSLLKQKMAEIEQTALEEEGIQSGMSAKGEFQEAFSEFQWEWETQPASMEGLNEVALTVYRKDHPAFGEARPAPYGTGRPRRFSLVTYVEDKKDEE